MHYMTEISKNELLELSNDFINDWHDVQAHRQRMTGDNLDSRRFSFIFPKSFRFLLKLSHGLPHLGFHAWS